MHGFGTLEKANGFRYEGEFHEGKCNGWGIEKYSDGSQYTGEF